MGLAFHTFFKFLDHLQGTGFWNSDLPLLCFCCNNLSLRERHPSGSDAVRTEERCRSNRKYRRRGLFNLLFYFHFIPLQYPIHMAQCLSSSSHGNSRALLPSSLPSEFLSRYNILCFSTTVCLCCPPGHLAAYLLSLPHLLLSLPALPGSSLRALHRTGSLKNTEQLGNAPLYQASVLPPAFLTWPSILYNYY